MLECWPAPSRPRSGTGWRSSDGGGFRTRRRPGRRYTPGADTSSPQQVSVSDKSYHVYRLQMVQTVNAKNLLDKNLMMYCLPPTPQYIQSSENRSHSLFSIEDYRVLFFQASFTFAMLASQMRTWAIAASTEMITLAKWPSVRYVNYFELFRFDSSLQASCLPLAMKFTLVCCLLKVDELFLIFVSLLRGSPLF